MYSLTHLKISFLGCGQMAQSLLQAYLYHSEIAQENIFISGRNLQKTKRVAEKFKVQMVADNEELLEKSSIIFLCVKPFDGEEAVQALRNNFDSNHTFISVMAGISLNQIEKWGLSSRRVIRIMPNIGARIGESFVPFCTYKNKPSLQAFMEVFLKPLGKVMALDSEELLNPLTVASASGIGFFFEILEYWIEWLQGQGFSYQKAREISVQTFLAAGFLAQKHSEKKLQNCKKKSLLQRELQRLVCTL